ncbi:hypothetical protein [Gramella sp. MAR_2010_147]|uniref:hypothetical protein n=1 Tax=Gramella sp. MAR_2010_147 TaxID=1250205 RepID=UPI00087AB0AE|nr:hypothetical protein [Gramella sp. MAR_2010_147]SDS46801.1 hypothetical protein SAMN04488553_2325 [Gramella sp. MAR_2010_147]
MKGSSGKRRLVKKYVSDFIFSEKTRFVLDGTNYQFSSDEPGGKFIKFRFEKNPSMKKRKYVFKCIYKMMRNFQSSLN